MIHFLKDYFKSLIPANTPPEIAEKGDLLSIQEHVLHALYLCGALIALPAIFFVAPIIRDSRDIYLGVGFSVLSAVLIIFALWRRAPYKLRANAFLLILYAAAVYSFYQSGFTANGGAFLVCYVILTVVLFGSRQGGRSALFSLLTLVFLAFAYKSILFPAPQTINLLTVTSTGDWIRFGLSLVFLAGLSATGISILLNRLNANLIQARLLSGGLQTEQRKLDRLLKEGISRMERRELQMRTASQISREISTNLDSKTLLDKVVNSIRDNFELYYVGLFLVDPEGRYAVLRAGTGDAGAKMISAGHRLEIGGVSMIGWCISNHQARIALDVGSEQVRFNNPYLPRTHSEMALPIVFQNQALGALSIQSIEPNAFGDEDIVILQGIADSLAIALENARLFQSTQQALEELRLYNKSYIQETWGQALAAQGELSYTFQNQEIKLSSDPVHAVSIPVTLRDEKIGDIRLETSGETFSPDDLSFLDAILTQTALALENARLLEETQRRAVQEQKLNDLSTQLSKASSIEYILQTAARELGQLPMVSEVSVQLVSKEDELPVALPGSNGNGKEH